MRQCGNDELSWSNGGKDMAVNWRTDVDQALAEAKETGKPALLDFSAAPM
jgi:hypothetical protein